LTDERSSPHTTDSPERPAHQDESVSPEDRSDDLASAAVSEPAQADVDAPLLPSEQLSEFEQRWQRIQAGFVDEPHQAVEEADRLVADLIERLATSFSESRSRLETQWEQGDNASTEELRIAFMRYRSFFKRLLSA
jgi:hypothetical protein